MSKEDFRSYIERLTREAREHAEEGNRIVQKDMDPYSIRAAASQLYQAAKALEQLDGALQAKVWLNRPEEKK